MHHPWTFRAPLLPFQGGTLCVVPPFSRAIPQGSGGSPKPAQDCTGAWRLDLNAFAAGALGGNPRPELAAAARG